MLKSEQKIEMKSEFQLKSQEVKSRLGLEIVESEVEKYKTKVTNKAFHQYLQPLYYQFFFPALSLAIDENTFFNNKKKHIKFELEDEPNNKTKFNFWVNFGGDNEVLLGYEVYFKLSSVSYCNHTAHMKQPFNSEVTTLYENEFNKCLEALFKDFSFNSDEYLKSFGTTLTEQSIIAYVEGLKKQD